MMIEDSMAEIWNAFESTGSTFIINNEPKVIDKTECYVESLFTDDINALMIKFPELASQIGSPHLLQLEITLKEIFKLCPRNRQRVDRYNKLIDYLKKNYNVVLTIKSQKKI